MEAVRQFVLAADEGSANGAYHMGFMYCFGIGVGFSGKEAE
jgi:TPR repeat protein